MDELLSWERSSFEYDGESREVYRKGSGPGVIVIHEIPGIEAELIHFADEVVERGHTVLLPHLFGKIGAGFSFGNAMGDLAQFCVRREFTLFARGRTSPIANWLRALARSLHDEVGGPGVGVVGMCFTGGFALAMMADAPVIAPVLAEPSLPFPVGAKRGADLGLSPADLAAVKDKTSKGCQVLGVRYRTDPATGTRFDTLRLELGDTFLAVQLEGKGHSVLTADRNDAAVNRVLDFFDEKLLGSAPVGERDSAMEHALASALPEISHAEVGQDPARVTLVTTTPLSAEARERVFAVAEELSGIRPLIEERA